MLGVASIMPFVAVLSNPAIIHSNNIINTLFQSASLLGVENNVVLFLLGILVFIVLTISLSLKSLSTYYNLDLQLGVSIALGSS